MFSRLMLTINFYFLFHTFILFAIQTKCTEATAVEEAFKKSKIVGDVVSVAPKQLASVTFGDVVVYLGTELSQLQVLTAPSVTYQYDPDSLYTLAIVDPDALTPQNPTLALFIQWIVVNIPGDDVTKGDIIAFFLTPTPPPGSDPHRYVALVYKQSKKFNPLNYPVQIAAIQTRIKFSIEDFTKLYCIEGPIAGNFFLVQSIANKIVKR